MGQAVLVFLLVWLVALGLNISNQGINQLSGEARAPVINIRWHDQVLHWDWLGQGHDYPLSTLKEDLKVLDQRICKYLHGAKDKLLPQ